AAWLTGSVPPLDDAPSTWSSRLHAAATRVARREPGVLLALPSHAGGWLAPAVLVERLRAGHDNDPELAQALLRLAPDGRDPALAAALGGRVGAIVRCAFGGEAV